MRRRDLLLITLVLLPPAAARELTFARDIAPIVYSNCSPCHRPGGAAPFPLLNGQDVKRRGAQVVAVTHSGFMPPWLPQADCGDFAGARRLTAGQIRAIADWVA